MEQKNWELLAKHLSGDLEEEEKSNFNDWLIADPAHQALVDKCEKLWSTRNQYDDLTDEQFLKAIGTDKHRVWNNIELAISSENAKTRIIPWYLKAAASVLIVLGIGWLFSYNSSLQNIFGNSELAVSGNKSQQILLADGTTVWLNKNSSLEYPKSFGSAVREVILEGEAYFDVQRDEAHPFIIKTELSAVEVLGTSFNVEAPSKKEDVVVTVTSGKVALYEKSNTQNKVILTQGELGRFDPLLGRVTEQENQNLNFLAWKTGILTFNNETLGSVLTDLSKHYQKGFTISNEAIGDKKLTATFDNQTLEEVLHVICSVHDLKFSQSDSKVTLSERN